MDDPRVERSQRHSLVNIIVILAVICSADTWVDIAFFGQRKQHWLRTSLDLTNSILSHDTFGGSLHGWMQHTVGRLFPALVQSLATVFQGQVVALDGKTVRHSHCRAGGDDNVAPAAHGPCLDAFLLEDQPCVDRDLLTAPLAPLRDFVIALGMAWIQ